jgi:tetratricopeptide (TPR) repeat protein
MKHRPRLTAVVVLLCAVLSCDRRPGVKPPSGGSDAGIRLNNLGVAEMNRGRTLQAVELFRSASRSDPTLFLARLNEGIALLNAQRFDEARDVLLDATRKQPDNARAWYNLGILYRNQAQLDSAVAAFEQVSRIDPEDADTFYFLGQLHGQAARYDRAIASYQRCLELDPLHLSAEFGLARAYQLSGNDESARQHLARFDELTRTGIGKPISLAYGEQGPYSAAEPAAGVADAPDAFAVRFSAVTRQAGIPVSTSSASTENRVVPLLGSGACFIDYDNDDRQDLLLLGEARGIAIYHNEGREKFTDSTPAAGFDRVSGALGCAIGDYDNDGLDDVVIGFQNRLLLYRNEGNGRFRDVTSAAGMRVDGIPLGILFVDYDHDGDLDFYVSRFTDFPLGPRGQFDFPRGQNGPGNLLWRNNGNGTFTESADRIGLAGDAPSVGALATDFNNDRAVDLILTGWRSAPAAYTNAREGPFRSTDVWKSAFPGPAIGAVAFDFNKDGWMDVAFTHWSQPGLSVWKNLMGKGFEEIKIPLLQWSTGWGVAAVDMDNDGWIDLAAVGEANGVSQLLLLRNMGSDRFVDVTKAAGVDSLGLTRPRALLAADIDGDGDSDLLVTQNAGSPVLLRNDGGNRRNSVRVALQGLHDNRRGTGAKIEVFSGASRQKWEVSSSGYLGQGSSEIVAGIDSSREADIVRLLWPTGVLQDEVQLPAGQRHRIKEVDRRGSSCPVLFVWNGKQYDFVSDIIGPGIVGEWIGPGERNVPDPTEYLKIDGSNVRLKNGRLSFRFAEVMEETTYLDHVRLIAVDHPSGVRVNPNEYFASLPPFPEFKVIASRNVRPPRAARGDRMEDVLPLLSQQDRRYVADFDLLPYRGFARMHYLELDLGDIDSTKPLRLIMHGFVDYFTVTSIFAAYQGNVTAVAPFLEVQDRSGKWTRVMDDIGFPAGLARTMIADLTGHLPPGVSRVRIGTNLKIYWDQILMDTTADSTPVELHEVPAVEASFGFRGYPRKVEGGVDGDVSYIHEDVSPTGPFSRPSGYYTAYGNVLPLIAQADDRFVVIGSGDEVALEFDPSHLPPLRPGWSRDYFFYADGFAKDMDFYSAHSDSVEPLPFHSMGAYPYGTKTRYPNDAEHLSYRLLSNTRHIKGNEMSASYRFQYSKRRD